MMFHFRRKFKDVFLHDEINDVQAQAAKTLSYSWSYLTVLNQTGTYIMPKG